MMSRPAFGGLGTRLTLPASAPWPGAGPGVVGGTVGCGTVAVTIGKPMLTLGQATSLQQLLMTIATHILRSKTKSRATAPGR